jgi:hypothetical protein
MNLSDLIAVLSQARSLIVRPENDFPWSSWQNTNEATAEIDGLLKQLEAGNRPWRGSLEILFLPTGPLQEVSVNSGWEDEFLELADRFDAVMMDVYSDPQLEICDCLTTAHRHLSALKELGLDWHHAQVSVLICQRCGQHWLKYFYENEGFTASGRWFLGAISFDQVSSLTLENAREVLEKLDWYFVGGSYYGAQINKASGEISLPLY